METRNSSCKIAVFSRLNRVVLHLRCLLRDRKGRWHLAGILREITLQ
jgi:hypothetical protein